MGQDGQPKHRQQARDIRRRAAQRAPYERILIVCEGEKTEVNYFEEIRNELRLSTTNVGVFAGALGTEPSQIVEYAESLFRNGDPDKGIEPRAFDRVVVVFDRDEHQTYFNALAQIRQLDKALKNDNKESVSFEAVTSVPCFELWLLLHFEDIQAPIHRNEVYQRLKKFLPDYDKGQKGYWTAGSKTLQQATERAQARAAATNEYDGSEPFTSIHVLIERLLHLKD